MAGGLGKGLKPGSGSELFKKTETAPMGADAQLPTHDKTQTPKNINVHKRSSAEEHLQNNDNAQGHKGADVRKHIVLPEVLAERLRRYCYERRQKEARTVREALDMFLSKEGF